MCAPYLTAPLFFGSLDTMKRLIRGDILTYSGDPWYQPVDTVRHYIEQGAILVDDGHITAVGPAKDLRRAIGPEIPVDDYTGHLLLPGFVDAHVHYPQTEMIGAHGHQLIDWLNTYTFVTEQCFADPAHASEVARVFLQEQLRNGVTSSCVFCTVHPQSVEALFTAAAEHNLRIIAGKVCMDRHAPAALLDTAETAYADSRALLEKWHGKGRAEYAITPRFAPTSSPAQLAACGALAREFPGVVIQSHVSENRDEVVWAQSLFPAARHYTDIYLQHGLLRPRAVYGHGVHLSDAELDCFAACGAAIAHCPTSNFFLGSGYLDVNRVKQRSRPVAIGLATDLGAGTSFSMLQTLNEAYKAAKLSHSSLPASHAFYLATRGSAEILGIADKVGALQAGMEADVTVLNWRSTPLIDYRMRYANDLEEALFIQMTLADDRAIAATYVAGERVHEAPGECQL